MFEKRKIKIIKNIKEEQKEHVIDDYTAGLYNGLEMAVSILEGSKAEFIFVQNETKVTEKEEEGTGRTIMSGIIKGGN